MWCGAGPWWHVWEIYDRFAFQYQISRFSPLFKCLLRYKNLFFIVFFFILSLKNKYKFSLPIKRTYYPRWFLYDNKDCLLSFISHRIFIASQIQEYIYKFLSKSKKIFQLRSIHFLFIFKIAESYHISQFKIKERINYNLEKLTSKLDVWVSRGITSRQSIKRPITKAIRAYRDFNYPFTSTFHVAPPLLPAAVIIIIPPNLINYTKPTRRISRTIFQNPVVSGEGCRKNWLSFPLKISLTSVMGF